MSWMDLRKEFDSRLANNKTIKSILAKSQIRYADANKYAIETGKILGDLISTTEVFPDGVSYEEALSVLEPLLNNNYKLVRQIAKKAQDTVNAEAGLKTKSVVSKPKPDLIPGLAKEVSDRGGVAGFEKQFADQIGRFTMTAVDDTVQANAYEYKNLGLSPKVVRESEPGCCQWCTEIAGEYDADEAKSLGVYRRHDNCRCTIEYVIDNISTTVRNYKRNNKEREKRIENNLKRGR